jgi:hypothetical protein
MLSNFNTPGVFNITPRVNFEFNAIKVPAGDLEIHSPESSLFT